MNIFTKIVQYLKDSVTELRKVVWPTKKQTINYSLIVIAMAIGVAVFFAVLDNIFNLMLEFIIK